MTDYYPNTYKSVEKDTKKVERPEVFEPALLHFARAFRVGDPVISDPKLRHEWYQTRRQVIDHLLTLIQRSVWKDHLVLRGSLLLKAWIGEEAREPGDIDWVFRPADIPKGSLLAQRFLGELRKMVTDSPYVGAATIDTNHIAEDDIWSYERASGRRILFPWKVPGLPAGEVQMDIVFQEELPEAPIRTNVPLVDGSELPVWSASMALSLAWKIHWLETDMHPQGKDLYDAVLLAEQTYLPLDLLERVVHQSQEWHPQAELSSNLPFTWYVDWDNFTAEYPWVKGDVQGWQSRLSAALKATFQGMDES